MREAIRIHQKYRRAPLGWYTGRSSIHSIELVPWRRAASSTPSDTYADDLPYWLRGPNGPFLAPLHLDANDMRFATPQGFNSGDQFPLLPS